MRTHSTAIISAVLTLIDSLSVSSVAIPAYTSPPADVQKRYFLVMDTGLSEVGHKDTFMSEGNLTVSIFDRMANDSGQIDWLLAAEDAVLAVLKTSKSFVLTLDDGTMITWKVETQDRDFFDLGGGEKMAVSNITFRYMVEDI